MVELIVLNIGLDAGVINERIFTVMVVMALLTTFMTSPLIALIYPPKYQQAVHPQRITSMRKHPPTLALLDDLLFKMSPASSTSNEHQSQPQQLQQLQQQEQDENILVYLENIDSIPQSATFLQVYYNEAIMYCSFGIQNRKTNFFRCFVLAWLQRPN